MPLFLTLAFQASAGTITETAAIEGLMGCVTLDCSLYRPTGAGGRSLSYVIIQGDRLMHRRNFGNNKIETRSSAPLHPPTAC